MLATGQTRIIAIAKPGVQLRRMGFRRMRSERRLHFNMVVGGPANKIERHLIENDMLRGMMSEQELLDLQ